MQAIEITVYLLVALVIGVMILQFLTSWSVVDTYDAVYQMLAGRPEPAFREVAADQFVADAFAFWKSCGMGEIEKTLALHIVGDGTLDKQRFFEQIQKTNLCDSLQSAQYGCGRKENVEFIGDFELPVVVRLLCNTTSERLVIQGR